MRVRLPADIDMADRIFAGLTLRQLAILSADGALLWLLWLLLGSRLTIALFAAVALPLGAAGLLLATASTHGVPLDRLLLDALRFLRAPRRRVLAPEGIPPRPPWLPGPAGLAPVDLPVEGVAGDGRLDLGTEGAAVVCRASSLNFGLRAAAEQQALVEGFGRLLNSFEGPVQFLLRSARLDLGTAIAELEEGAARLPHRALEEAAREHASFLRSLSGRADVFRREAYVCLRERAGSPEETSARLGHRREETASLLRGIGIGLHPISASEAARLLARACDPEAIPAPERCGTPTEVVRGPAR